jgi:hypothetical protein
LDVQPDFRDLLKLFNENEVEFVVVGSYALAFHGAPRYTGDIDLYIQPTLPNAKKVLRSLQEFGFGSLNLAVEDFTSQENVVQLGVPPVRVDLLTSISGIEWDAIQEDKEPGQYGDLDVFYIGRRSYITNKRASGRAKDIADIEALGE